MMYFEAADISWRRSGLEMSDEDVALLLHHVQGVA